MEAAEKRSPQPAEPHTAGPVAALQRPRVLHYPTDVGGNPSGLSRAERRLGVSSTVAVHHRSWLGYPVDIDLGIDPRSPPTRL